MYNDFSGIWAHRFPSNFYALVSMRWSKWPSWYFDKWCNAQTWHFPLAIWFDQKPTKMASGSPVFGAHKFLALMHLKMAQCCQAHCGTTRSEWQYRRNVSGAFCVYVTCGKNINARNRDHKAIPFIPLGPTQVLQALLHPCFALHMTRGGDNNIEKRFF